MLYKLSNSLHLNSALSKCDKTLIRCKESSNVHKVIHEIVNFSILKLHFQHRNLKIIVPWKEIHKSVRHILRRNLRMSIAENYIPKHSVNLYEKTCLSWLNPFTASNILSCGWNLNMLNLYGLWTNLICYHNLHL